MEIQCGDVYCKIVDGLSNLPAVAAIRSICRARPQGYQFMPKYKKGQWDGYISLMHGTKFPTGLLSLVLNSLNTHRIKYALIYNTSPDIEPCPISDCSLKGITLRDYQLDAINQLVSAKRGVAKMATNSGKTEVMAGIIHTLNYPKTLVLLHRKELLYQTAERFVMRLGIEIGMIGDGIWNPKYITVAMIQTLYNNMHDDLFKDTQLVMVDECHHSSSDSYMEVLEEIPGKYRYGFSGTPLKYDLLSDMKLMSFTGDVVVDVSNQYLIDEGFSAVPKVFTVSLPVPEGNNYGDLDYQTAYRLFVVENDVRNKKIAELAKASSEDGVVLILVNRIDHGKRIKKLVRSCQFVNGAKSTEERRIVLDNMRSGSGIYCATPIFDEGIDVPAVNTIIMAGSGRSHIKLLQRIGRGLRKKANNILTVYDFVDEYNNYLYEHYEARRDVYVQEGFEVIRI